MKKPDLLKQYQFKGTTLQPFSKGRLSMAIAAGLRIQGISNDAPGPLDIFGILFLCVCDVRTRGLCQLNPSQFWEEVVKWQDQLDLGPEDYKEATDLVIELLQSTLATKADPKNDDLSFLEDPDPN